MSQKSDADSQDTKKVLKNKTTTEFKNEVHYLLFQSYLLFNFLFKRLIINSLT